MKARCLLILLTIFLFGCENTIFQELTGVDGESGKDSSENGKSPALSTPLLTYDINTMYLSWEAVNEADIYWVYCGTSSSLSALRYLERADDRTYYVGNYSNTYFAVKAYSSKLFAESGFSNVIHIGNSSNSSSDGESGGSGSSDSSNIITETITYTTNSGLAGYYYIRWTNSGKSATSNPYLCTAILTTAQFNYQMEHTLFILRPVGEQGFQTFLRLLSLIHRIGITMIISTQPLALVVARRKACSEANAVSVGMERSRTTDIATRTK